MKQEHARALFEMAGFEVKSLHQLSNGYWPDVPDYAEVRRLRPWWLAITQHGPIVIGWRKRVINIDWSDTPLRHTVTEDDVTKSETMVHAYSYPKAMEYLWNLTQAAENARIAAIRVTRDAEQSPVVTEKK